MKKSRCTEEQIIGILKQHEAGVKTADLCREHGISAATFYGWKSKYGGMDVSEAQRLKAMEDENRRLKLLVAELSNYPQQPGRRGTRRSTVPPPVSLPIRPCAYGWSQRFSGETTFLPAMNRRSLRAPS